MTRRTARARLPFAGLLLLALAVAAGCVAPRKAAPVDPGGPNRWVSVDVPRGSAPSPPASADALLQASRAETVASPPKPRTILALSGGGMYGAYTAGVLNGWTQSGRRPDFDVVSGISTGALIAPMAFVGSEYDGPLGQIYTNLTRRDIFTYRRWATIPFRESLAVTAPLRAKVGDAINDELVARIAAEHRRGRRLYVGTTNLDTRRFCTWDVGAIACRADPARPATAKAARDLILDVLIASCSLPGIFPPVPIEVEVDGKTYTELHVDGGVTACVFVPPSVMDAAALDPGKPAAVQPPADLYIVMAGKAYPEAAPVESRVIDVLAAFMGTAQAAQNRRDVANLYHMARLAGVRFHMTAVPGELGTSTGGLSFDKKEMNALFDEGTRVGLGGPLWLAGPPERGPGEVDAVRTGTKFVTGR